MSSTDQDPTSDAARRKFDEVASLFGPIVPPAGSPVRPRVPASTLPQASDAALWSQDGPQLAPPPNLRAPASEPIRSRPIASPALRLAPEPDASEPEPTRPAPPRDQPRDNPFSPEAEKSRRAVRKDGTQARWPDAFAPRPNYHPGRNWRWLYWLFLIPFAAVVAVAVTFVDPRAIRAFVDQTLPQYLPTEVTQFFTRPVPAPTPPEPPIMPRSSSDSLSADMQTAALPLVPNIPAPDPAPVRPPAPPIDPPIPVSPIPPEQTAPAPAAVAPTPDTTAPVAETSAAPTAPASATVAQVAPASPSGPAPANEGSDPVPVPPEPRPGALSAGPARVVIYYRRSQAGSEGEARRIAAKVGNAEIRPSTTTSRSPMIYYFNPADREAATGLARTLSTGGLAGWIVRAGPARQGLGGIDVLVP